MKNTITNGKATFTHFDEKEISVAWVADDGFVVLYGTSQCCFGNIVKVHFVKEGPKVSSVLSAPSNVMDMMPVGITDEGFKAAGFVSEGVGIVVGYGCAGTGVWLMEMNSPSNPVQLMGHEEFQSMNPMGRSCFCKVKFRFTDEGRIFLDYARNPEVSYRTSYRKNEESVDLTDRLKAKGFDPERTRRTLERWKRTEVSL